MSERADRLVWVDCEMTGLELGHDLLIEVAALVTDLVRDDVGGVPSYLLHCERSSGQYLVDALLDAGAEFGVGVDT